ncbi:MAG: 23S rRNA (pseudouridine(1915)-N(3))-methyltransferase RlmH [Clostridia bacterium]|nr:23S rRNA (pseudouridine(1915)-N(3))-methyltransferase RlmH [Clostridia bacterium]
MNVKIIAVGKIKSGYIKTGIKDYQKRLKPYCNLKIVEVPDQKAPQNLSAKEVLLVKQKEGQGISKHIKQGEYLIALDLKGNQISSEQFADKLNDLALSGKSNIDFIIGGSLGLSQDIIKRSHIRQSFSPMTFPHQLARLILLEQIYRGFKIIKGEPYHK